MLESCSFNKEGRMFGWLVKRERKVRDFEYFPGKGYAILHLKKDELNCCMCERRTFFLFRIDSIIWPCCNEQNCYEKCVSEAKEILG